MMSGFFVTPTAIGNAIGNLRYQAREHVRECREAINAGREHEARYRAIMACRLALSAEELDQSKSIIAGEVTQ